MTKPTAETNIQRISACILDDSRVDTVIEISSNQNGSDVLLIDMPFDEVSVPSIGLSLLKPALSPLGVSTRILYFNLKFVRLIGISSYYEIVRSNRYDQIGNWIFSGALFGDSTRNREGYIEEILCRPPRHLKRFLNPVPGKLIRTVLKVQGKVDRFLDECEKEVLNYHSRIVGFSSTFQQQIASLALAKRIKNHSPDTFILFGGADCEDIMGVEMARQFPFIDAVVSGEGDIAFPQLVQQVLEGKSLHDLQGVYTQSGIPSPRRDYYPIAPLVKDLDTLPYPNYDDFFHQLGTSRINLPDPLSIPIQTSRGRWWGEKIRCTFCGCNGSVKKYRSKSGRRVLDELMYLLDRYPVPLIIMVDNILEMGYFKHLLPEIAQRRLGAKFVCEVKSNLNKDQIRILRDAQFAIIQPGVQSLSSSILRIMSKGVDQLQNVELLKWCKEFDIAPFWNLLWGSPFEPAEEYERMARLIPLLVHLQPPQYFGCIRIDRFSPNFERADQFGFKEVFPSPSYHHIYPFEPEVVANLSYYFTCKYHSDQNVKEYTRPVEKECVEWRNHFDFSDLFFVDQQKKLFIWDERPIAYEPLTILSGLQRDLYIACDSAQSISRLVRIAESINGKKFPKEQIEQILQSMMDKYLMIKDGDSYLSLAIPVGDYVPRKDAFERFERFLQRMEANKQHETLIKRIKVKEVLKDIRVGKEEIVFAAGHVCSTGN